MKLGIALLVLSCTGLTAANEVNFSRDVAPILYKRCVSCHHANDIAPMSLVTYEDARPWARAIREAVLTGQMPPWHADPHYGQFSNDRRLTQTEIETIKAWVDGGTRQGDPKDVPPAPQFPDGWKIGNPDVVIPIPKSYVVKANSPDAYLYFTVPTNFKEDTWVTAVELRPENRRVVHHAHVFLQEPPKPKAANDAKVDKEEKDNFTIEDGQVHHINPVMPVLDDGCSSVDGGNWPGRHPSESHTMLGSYLPGKDPDIFPEGYARLIPAGSSLGFQIHYNSRSIKADETDRTSVALVFAKEPPRQRLRRVDISNYLFRIPAGDPNHEVTACYVFPKDAELMSYTAHMHLRGKDMKFEAVHTDGRRETLFSVPKYDFNWQTEYQLNQPVAIEKGTKIIITAHFDNSPNNKYNPDPSKTIRWGEPSTEEMMDGWFEYILPATAAGKPAQAERQ
ncbi:MAG: heme-binding domain-containing protein [Acidobacteriia bacterium]|nr:heme-binding domain-containing protein [Terriglobia bacterium]